MFVLQVYLDSSDIQHEKLSLKLVSPHIDGYSVAPDTTSDKQSPDTTDKQTPGTKRSTDSQEKTPNKKSKKQ